MYLRCSNCNTEIKSENINIATDLAQCQNCGAVLKVSALAHSIDKIETSPPSGSSILMTKGMNGLLELTLPKKGFTFSVIPKLLFSIFWLGFLSFWTWGASQASVLFALFSIPFWLVGLRMIVGVINSANEVQKISLNKSTLSIERIRPIRPQSFKTELNDIQAIKMKQVKMNPFAVLGDFRTMMRMQGSFGSPVETPAIITGMKTEHFFEDANDAEQEWVTQLLQSLVKQIKK